MAVIPKRTAFLSELTAAAPRRRWSDGPSAAPGNDCEWSDPWPTISAIAAERMADAGYGLKRQVEELARGARLLPEDARALMETIDGLCRTGRSLQQVVRLRTGAAQPAGELVELEPLVRRAAMQRKQQQLRGTGSMRLDLRDVEVWIDPVVAVSAIEAALDWAVGFSDRVAVKLAPPAYGKPARLVVRGSLARQAHAPAKGRRDRRMSDNLEWLRLRQLCEVEDLTVSRSSTGATEAVVIEFGGTHALGEGLSSVGLIREVTGREPDERVSVLVLIAEEALRNDIAHLLAEHGIDATVVVDGDQARLMCCAAKPRVIIGCAESPVPENLRVEWALEGHRSALVHITRNTPRQAHPAPGVRTAIVGRPDLSRELIPAILFEIAQLG